MRVSKALNIIDDQEAYAEFDRIKSALHELSQELSQTQLILTNVEMDRYAYKKYAAYLNMVLRHESSAGMVYTFDEFLVAKDIPHPDRQT